ncbi:hypothetical protein D3C81_2309010 [compost metagenome]
MERIPGAFAFLGMGEASLPLHHPLFDVNEEVLTVGAKLFVQWVSEAVRRNRDLSNS